MLDRPYRNKAVVEARKETARKILEDREKQSKVIETPIIPVIEPTEQIEASNEGV